jgi:hypothetical protein
MKWLLEKLSRFWSDCKLSAISEGGLCSYCDAYEPSYVGGFCRNQQSKSVTPREIRACVYLTREDRGNDDNL